MAGVDPTDKAAAAAGLPPVDSINAWEMITGASKTPLRKMMQLSSNTMIDTVGGWKIIVSGCAIIRGGLACDVTGMNMWTPSVYPNRTQPDGGGYGAPANCTQGCMYNVLRDPSEREELSSEEPTQKKIMLAALEAAQANVIQTPMVADDPACCRAAAQDYGHFLGPFLA